MDGFLNFNKPKGWTSHDCVAFVRRQVGLKKVGHGGTLDPAATGVLPLALGRATRLIQYLRSDKAYRATIRFGVRTTTDDLDGDPLETKDASHLSLDDVCPWLEKFRGSIQQVPPRYSAVQIGGRRLYELARSGVDVDIPVRTVEVFSLKVLQWRSPSLSASAASLDGESGLPELDLAITCSGGTYIRAIARDLGHAVGTGATLAALCRTESSGFSLDDSLTPDRLEQAVQAQSLSLVHPAIALHHLPPLSLIPNAARRWRMGQRILLEPAVVEAWPSDSPAHGSSSAPSTPPNLAQTIRVLESGDRFLGIGQVEELSPDGYFLRPKMVFDPA